MEITGIIFIDLIIKLVAGLVVPVALFMGAVKLSKKFPRTARKTGNVLTPMLDFCATSIAILVGLAILLAICSLIVDWTGWAGFGVVTFLFLGFLWLDHRRVKKKK
jgi:O-antigen ligase